MPSKGTYKLAGHDVKPRRRTAYNVTVRCSCCGKPVKTFTDISEREQLWSITPRCCERCSPSNTMYATVWHEDGGHSFVYLRHEKCKCGKGPRPTPLQVALMD